MNMHLNMHLNMYVNMLMNMYTKMYMNMYMTSHEYMFFWRTNGSFLKIFSSVTPPQRSARSQVPSQVETHHKIGSQLWGWGDAG